MSDQGEPKKQWVENAKAGGMAVAKGLAGLVPGGGIATELVNAAEGRKRQREAEAVQLAIQRLDMQVEELSAKLANDEELAELWDRAMQAARSTRIDAKRHMFSAIMAGAVTADHNERLKANILIRLLDQLEEEHLQVMVVIEDQMRVVLEETKPEHYGAEPKVLTERLSHLTGTLDVVLSSLLSLNIIRNVWERTYNGLSGEKRYALTVTGRALCKVLTTSNVEAGPN